MSASNDRRLAVTGHLRRYPWWYGLAAVWLVAMMALPVVHLGPLDTATRTEVAAGPGPTTSGAGPSSVTSPFGSGATVGPFGGTGGGTGGPVTTVAGARAATPTTKPGALTLVPPALLDLVFNAIPQVVVPPLPEGLAPIARALAPIAATGCSGLGLASVVVAVVAQSANGVPVQRILPYLSPLSTACASFPIPAHHTVCAADPPFVVNLGGLTSTPPILGLGIDEVQATQTLLSQKLRSDAPRPGRVDADPAALHHHLTNRRAGRHRAKTTRSSRSPVRPTDAGPPLASGIW